MNKNIEVIKIESNKKEIPEHIKRRNINRFYSYYMTGFICSSFGFISVYFFYDNLYITSLFFFILFILGLPFMRVKK